MRRPDTPTSLTSDQYNGNHAHSIVSLMKKDHLMSSQPNKALTLFRTGFFSI